MITKYLMNFENFHEQINIHERKEGNNDGLVNYSGNSS